MNKMGVLFNNKKTKENPKNFSNEKYRKKDFIININEKPNKKEKNKTENFNLEKDKYTIKNNFYKSKEIIETNFNDLVRETKNEEYKSNANNNKKNGGNDNFYIKENYFPENNNEKNKKIIINIFETIKSFHIMKFIFSYITKKKKI